ncbi:MAG: sulfatase-like hydrolase/transferase [Burkholderiales bacterium]|nr:sulfatase-like hydrolase/transferase [Burkholderiales bacterium]
MATKKPNILLILTDQQRFPPVYESEELRRFRRETLRGEESLRESGISFDRHYTMSAACTPSRASFLTGQYPSLHGVTQTDGLAKGPDDPEMAWLAPDSVPTVGDWFRAGGYRTFYKGKWHVSHVHLDAPDGSGLLQAITEDGTPIPENIATYLKADLLDPYGFSEWVGPEAHGLGKQNTGTVRDPFTADEVIGLLKRFDQEGGEQPWLTVCSFLNPHDIAIFGLVALAQGLRYDLGDIPSIPDAPTFKEDLSTKPAAQQSYINAWGKMLAPQPWIEAQRKFYFQVQEAVDEQIARVMGALRASGQYENTIVVFSTDHGDMLGAHGGMHQKWHVAYDEATHIPFVVSSPLLPGGRRNLDTPTSHADLLPTLLGLAGIDAGEALKRVAADHKEAHPLVGRDLSGLIRGTGTAASEPVLFMTDDEISEGSQIPHSPFQIWARKLGTYEHIVQPNHVEMVVAEIDVGGEKHLIKLTRYHDNPQYWTVPGERDERLMRWKKINKVSERTPDEYELYDLTADPIEQRNLAHPSNADDRSRALLARMKKILVEQLARKRRAPATGGLPGYQPPEED